MTSATRQPGLEIPSLIALNRPVQPLDSWSFGQSARKLHNLLKPHVVRAGMTGRKLELFVADDEAELVRSCLAGDTEGVRAFVDRFQGMIFGTCFRMLGHREDAEDIVQEVFLRAFRSLSRWDPTRPLKPWLLTIAANRCRTQLTLRANKPLASEFVDDAADPMAIDPMARGGQADLAEDLQWALDKVREEYRLCFILYHLHELTLTEISGVVGAPEGTVKTWLFRVRRELADHLRRRGVAPQVNHELH